VLVGPSGCGKSTLLRCIAGLETLTRGRVILDGRDVSNDEPRDRDIAMVFQSYALYPHLTVRENLAFGLKMRKTPRDEITRRVGEAAAILGLEALLDRRPAQLSGGQRQRVAMGRAVVRRPKAFLFDEPLSNLDASLRGAMRVELMRLHQKLGATMIYVTHDQVEAMTLADRIAVLQAGKLEQVGAPDELYGRPANLFVARFIGTPEMNVLAASRAQSLGLCGELPQDAAHLGARAEAVRLGRPQAQAFRSGGDGATGVVEVVEHLGWEALVHVGLGEAGAASELERVVARVESGDAPRPGERVRVTLDGEHVHFFDAGGARLEPKPALRAQP
jgi:ABC-type sugar transport system ATPase subunit